MGHLARALPKIVELNMFYLSMLRKNLFKLYKYKYIYLSKCRLCCFFFRILYLLEGYVSALQSLQLILYDEMNLPAQI